MQVGCERGCCLNGPTRRGMGRTMDATNLQLHWCQQISDLGRCKGIVQESTGFLQ